MGDDTSTGGKDRCPHCGTDGEDRLDNAGEDWQPDWYYGNDSRPSDMPTPPGAVLAQDGARSSPSGTITTYLSKAVMLRAERKDEIKIGHVVNGFNRIPEKYTVIERQACFHGIVLTLHAEVEGTDHNFQLTCPGPNTQLILWMSLTAPGSPWRNGWVPIAEVTAHISGVKQYRNCEHCDRPIKDIWHERLSVIGACEGVDSPEMDDSINALWNTDTER